ncbi:MAG: NUDIX hydrolase [Pirellulales bacterium]|nr:NUDIX hydrolase [Pirellulales bacterium]
MHRQPLLGMLDRYATRYPEESSVVARIRQLVESTPACFERTCRPGHVTGSAWVLSHDRTRCLLVHHRKLGRWLQPGGHADGECQIEQVALRELQEESGLAQVELVGCNDELVPLDVDVHRIPARLDGAGNVVETAHEHHDIRFLVLAATGQELVLSEESHAVRWFTEQELMSVTREESVLRMMRKGGPTTGTRECTSQ